MLTTNSTRMQHDKNTHTPNTHTRTSKEKKDEMLEMPKKAKAPGTTENNESKFLSGHPPAIRQRPCFSEHRYRQTGLLTLSNT